MKATTTLMEEHRVIERMLNILETESQRLEAGEAVRLGFFQDAATFIKGFADGCHHAKEEGVLFPSMAAKGVPVQGGPIGVMLYEHERGRELTRALRQAADQMDQGDTQAREQVIHSAFDYVVLLRQHIYKEDNILFPMADRVIPESEHEIVWDGFEKVEHEETGEGVHEKYLALVDKLEGELGS